MDYYEGCRSCVFWERTSRDGWGRCWAPDTDEDLGFRLVMTGAGLLETHEDFSCQAHQPDDDYVDDFYD